MFRVGTCSFRFGTHGFRVGTCRYRLGTSRYRVGICGYRVGMRAFRTGICKFRVLMCPFRVLFCTFGVGTCAFRRWGVLSSARRAANVITTPKMEQKGTKETKFFVIFVCFCYFRARRGVPTRGGAPSLTRNAAGFLGWIGFHKGEHAGLIFNGGNPVADILADDVVVALLQNHWRVGFDM